MGLIAIFVLFQISFSGQKSEEWDLDANESISKTFTLTGQNRTLYLWANTGYQLSDPINWTKVQMDAAELEFKIQIINKDTREMQEYLLNPSYQVINQTQGDLMVYSIFIQIPLKISNLARIELIYIASVPSFMEILISHMKIGLLEAMFLCNRNLF